jgi:hypothetical protein
MEVSQLNRFKNLEAENAKLKLMFAAVSLDLQMAKDVLSNLPTCCEQAGKC